MSKRMPALIGGFFRRGRVVIDYSSLLRIMTPVSPLINKKGSRLNAAILSNEANLEGSTKWGKGNSRHRYLSTLPSLDTRMS